MIGPSFGEWLPRCAFLRCYTSSRLTLQCFEERMASVLITGGHVLSPEDNLDGELDVRIEDGVIAEIGPQLKRGADVTLDASESVVAPGFIDIHVHLRE